MENKTSLDRKLEDLGNNGNFLASFLDGTITPYRAIISGLKDRNRKSFSLVFKNSEIRDKEIYSQNNLVEFSYWMGEIVGTVGIPGYLFYKIGEYFLINV